MRADAHLLGLHPARNAASKRLLVLLGQRLVGQLEQDVVFLVDVLAEQGDVAFGVVDEPLRARRRRRAAAASMFSSMPRTWARPCSCSWSITPVGPPSRGKPLASRAGNRWASSLP